MMSHVGLISGCVEWNKNGGNGTPHTAEVTIRRNLMRSEINPNADYATRQAQRAERQGDVKGAQWYRNARWSSYQRQVQGKSTHLRIDE